MNNKKTLVAKLNEIATLTNQFTNKDAAIKAGKTHYLYLEYASCYGGYRVVNVNVNNGGHSGAFGGSSCEARLSASKMAIKLDSILQGMAIK